ncbi:ABC transporter substrate-binding protein [Caldinitratiruptor microaerophilus]|uniref:ABC transporter substrate-binding protein n=1 Tax=Caldinitratiruptor microaerophilus TaxID=671077 RepID=A0AA35CMD9_9FIRM|nr:ABC transporter substrate-binding protein [Caldinitratiruptor microaerophilus]BDG61807.1 ABC transporter substrate-binding protein [Caldinitratiruptor microaerophilus]
MSLFHRRSRVGWLTAGAVALGLLVSACGGAKQPQTPPAQQGGQQAAQQEQAKPAGPKTLVWGRGGDTVSLDPIQPTDGESFKVINQIYDTLVRYKAGKTEVEPALATDWQASPDAKEWTFSLRQGVKFHDGTEFDAEAVKFNFDRWRDTKNPYHKGGEFAYYSYMFGGFDDKSVIQDVQVVDKYKVKFTLKRPLAYFLQNLAMPMFSIASPTAIKADPEALGQKPVGTGAYKFVDWKKGESITLEANPDYWGGKPKIDRIIYRSIPDNNARLLALQSGDIDVMDGVEPNQLQVIQSDDRFQVALRPAMNVGYLAFNMDKKPFDNPLVRKAINHAIDKKAIVETLYAGLGQVAVTPLPPSMWGWTDDVTQYPYDPQKAKQLLAQAGFPNGFKTQLWAMPVPRPYMPQPEKIAQAIQGYLKEVGIEAEIVTYEWATYLEKTGMGEHTMALLGWVGDNGDPDNFLYVLLDKDNAKGPDAGNIAFYRNDQLHELLVQAQEIPDQSRRAELYVRAQKIIAEDAPWVVLAHAQEPIVMKKGIQGYVPNPTGSEPLYQITLP